MVSENINSTTLKSLQQTNYDHKGLMMTLGQKCRDAARDLNRDLNRIKKEEKKEE